MKIAIFASIWSQNLWDELILKNEIKILEEKYSSIFNTHKKNIEFSVFTYDLKNKFYIAENIEYIEYFPIDFKNPKNIFRNLKNFFKFLSIVIKSDLIVIWWGGIFYDNELQSVSWPLKQWLFRTKIFKLFRKKIDFFRVGINIKNSKNLNLIKKIFSWAYKISVRDKYSFDLLKKINILNVQLLEDPVFFDKKKMNLTNNNSILNSFYLQEKEAHLFLIWNLNVQNLNVQNIKNILQQGGFSSMNLSWKKIWIALRRQEIKNYKENIIEIIKYFLEKKSEIILIPHSFHKTDEKANDFIFFEEILKTIKNSPIIPFKKGDEDKSRDVWQKHLDRIYICKNMQESYKIYTNKKIDLNLASRLHSIILSQVYEIPFIWISYSKKTDEIISLLSSQNQDI